MHQKLQIAKGKVKFERIASQFCFSLWCCSLAKGICPSVGFLVLFSHSGNRTSFQQQLPLYLQTWKCFLLTYYLSLLNSTSLFVFTSTLLKLIGNMHYFHFLSISQPSSYADSMSQAFSFSPLPTSPPYSLCTIKTHADLSYILPWPLVVSKMPLVLESDRALGLELRKLQLNGW